MTKTTWLGIVAMAVGLLSGAGVSAQNITANDLTPFLQAELNEIALLTAQANHLQQQGDPLGAAVIASYIPDHCAQSMRLSAVIRARGGDPSTVTPAAVQPVTGTRLQLLEADIAEHQRVVNQYQQLLDQAENDAVVQQIATLGLNGAARHFSSLQVARGATIGSPQALNEALIAELTLERGIIANLQTQATRLTQLGDQATADILLSSVPRHQAQVARLEALVRQMGGDPAQAVPPPTAPLLTRAQILSAQQVINTQMVNTYAIPIASLPDSPIRQAAVAGQGIVLVSLAQLQRLPVVG